MKKISSLLLLALINTACSGSTPATMSGYYTEDSDKYYKSSYHASSADSYEYIYFE